MPVALEERWTLDSNGMQCLLRLPLSFDPLVLMEKWLCWRNRRLEQEYAILN